MQLTREIANDLFGAAVHGRAVDYLAAELSEPSEHFLERRAIFGRIAHIKDLPRPEADDRNFLSSRRNDAHQHFCGLLIGRA